MIQANILKNFSSQLRMYLLSKSKYVKVPRGKLIFDAGEKIHYAYLLLAGSVKLSQKILNPTTYKYEKQVVNNYEDGSLFGEYSLLSR